VARIQAPEQNYMSLLVHERESRVAEQNREKDRAKKDPFQIQLPSLICRQRQERLKQLQREITQLDKAISQLIAGDEHLKIQSKLLCSIPGIAETTAAKLLSELAGKEFHSARQLAAYAGLTPSEFMSGGSAYGKTHLSKIGNAFLRKALYLPAAVARRWCKPLKPWVTLLEKRKLSDLAIRGAIMRKLLHIAFGILKHRKPFDPSLVFMPKTV
jgi:transposase